MLADGWRPTLIFDRRRAEFRERSGVTERFAQFRMRDALEVAARFELRTLDHFRDRRDRCDQKSVLECEREQLSLGVAAGEISYDFFDPLEFRKRLRAAEQVLAVCEPIFVARRLVAKAPLADEAHELGREDA